MMLRWRTAKRGTWQLKRLQIGHKVLLTMLAVVVPLMVLLSLLIINSTENILRTNATREVEELAKKSAQSLGMLVQNSKTTILTIARSPVVQGFLTARDHGNRDQTIRSLAKMEKAFLDFQQLDQTIQAIRFINPAGYVLVKVREGVIIAHKGTWLDDLGIRAISSKKDRDFFKEAITLNRGQVSISNLERGWMEGEDKWCPAMVRFSTPVFLSTGERAGVVTINVWGKTAGTTINQLMSPKAGSAFLIERNLHNPARNGIFLFYQNSNCEFGNQTGSRITVFQKYPPFITNAWMHRNEGVSIHLQTGDIVAYHFFSPYHRSDKGWVVVVNAKRNFFMAPLSTINNRIIWYAGLVLVLVVGAAFLVAQSITKPIRQVIAGTHHISKDLSFRIQVQSEDEVGTLALEINRMATALERHLEEKKRIADRICQSEKLASIGEMAAGLAHELNTPLCNARALSSLARKDLEKGKCDPAAIKNDLNDILEQTDKCAQIIAGLLSFARRQNPEFICQDINALLESSIALIRIRTEEKGVRVRFEKRGLLPQLKIDGHQMQQVFVNILLNAVDATPPGGQVDIRSGATAANVAIWFIDTGTGIRTGHLDKIFDPFFTTKEVGKGTGLGLAVSYGIVKNHGGAIEVESTPGRGTVFTVLLPTGERDNDTNSGD